MAFTVVDIETTGLSRQRHKITEIAAARVRNGKIIKTYESLINPEVKIPPFITHLTGIDDEMVKEAPRIDKVLPSFIKFLGKDVFVAHCATFDYRFLEHNLLFHHDIELKNDRLCTRKLANRIYPDLRRKRLLDLCEYLSVGNTQAHRAMGDVQATFGVFTTMLDVLKKKRITRVDDILKFERSAIRRF